MTRQEALVQFLQELRVFDVDSFADTYYLLAGELGIHFDHAACFYDFVNLDPLLEKIEELKNQGYYEAFAIAGVLSRLDYYIEEASERALLALRLNSQDLLNNPKEKPEVLLALAEGTNQRLLSQESQGKRLAFKDHYRQLKAQYFSQEAQFAWELEIP